MRKNLSKFTLITLFSGFLTLGFPTPAFACSCIASTIAEHVANADIVFHGTATAFSASTDSELVGAGMREAEFTVIEWIKGVPAVESFALSTSDSSASCGNDFVVGSEYLVFAFEDDNGYQSNLCGGTALVDANTQTLVDDARTAVAGGEVRNGSNSSTTATLISAPAEEAVSGVSVLQPWLVGLFALGIVNLIGISAVVMLVLRTKSARVATS